MRLKLSQQSIDQKVWEIKRGLFRIKPLSLNDFLKSFWGHFDTYSDTCMDQPLFSCIFRAEIVWTWVLLKLVKLFKWNGLMGCSTVQNTWDPTFPTCTRYTHALHSRHMCSWRMVKTQKRQMTQFCRFSPFPVNVELSQTLVKASPQ